MCFKPHSSFQSPPFFHTWIFDQRDETSETATPGPNSPNDYLQYGVSHADDIYYIFKVSDWWWWQMCWIWLCESCSFEVLLRLDTKDFLSINLMEKYFTDIEKIKLAMPFCKESIFASVKKTWPRYVYIYHIFNCALVSLEILLQLQFQHNFDYNSWSEANIATSHAMCQMWGDFAR